MASSHWSGNRCYNGNYGWFPGKVFLNHGTQYTRKMGVLS
jgi:hypothetical protein